MGIALAPSAAAATAGQQECTNALASAKVAETGGQLRDARISAQTCAVDPCSDDVQAECAAILERIDRTIASVTVAVVDAHGRQIPGAQVTIGEHSFAPEETVVLDPGDYKILIETPDGTQVTRLITLARGEAKRESVIVTSGAEVLIGGGGAAGSPPPPAIDTVGTTSPDGRRGPVISYAELALYRRLGVASAAVGFVSLGVGAYFGLLAHARSDEAGCSNGQCSSQATLSIHEDATTARNASIGFLVAGAIFGGGGVLLWYSAPRLATVMPPDIGGASIRVAPSIATGRPSATSFSGLTGLTVRGAF